jgi:hypothetical protein
MVNVVISNDTRTPLTNFSRGTLFLTPTTYRGPEAALTISNQLTPYIVDHPVASTPRQ